MRVLAGDVGGTHARLALFEVQGTEVRSLAEQTYPSGDYNSLEPILLAFVQSHDVDFEAAAFGIAGPVRDGVVTTTNLPWTVRATSLAEALHLPRATLLNDLEAIGWGLPTLDADDLVTLQEGTKRPGNGVLVAAGTGLGVAGLIRTGDEHRPIATEAGHTDFAPADDLDVALMRALRARFGHVSWERVVSGPGLIDVFDFLVAYRKTTPPPDVAQAASQGHAGAIAEAADAGRCAVCTEAIERFATYYGAVAGNMALTFLATGGVYIAGGIAPKMLPHLRTGAFVAALQGKGRLQKVLEQIPIRVVTTGDVGLHGAAVVAARGAHA